MKRKATSSSPNSQVKKRLLSEFYKGRSAEQAYESLNKEVTLQQLHVWFEALRRGVPIFRFKEKRCICWSCVPEVAECCANPVEKCPKLIQSNKDKLPFLPLYKWNQRGKKHVEYGFDHPNYASYDGRFAYDLDRPINMNLRIVDTFTGKSSVYYQDTTVNYRASPLVILDHYSISTMLFVQEDLAVVTLINDNKMVESDDMIGLLSIHHSMNRFCFLDIRRIDVRESHRGGQFTEYVEMFKLDNNTDSKEWKFGIILCRPGSELPFLTIYSLKKNHQNEWTKIVCDNENQLIPWSQNRGFIYQQYDNLYTMEVSFPGMRRRLEYHYDAPATHRYLLIPTWLYVFDMKQQQWDFHETNASTVPEIKAHFRATKATCPRPRLQMENAEWVKSRLYCSIRLKPSKTWHILIFNLDGYRWQVLNYTLPSRFWSFSVDNSNETLLLCSGYKLCRPANSLDIEHYTFFRLKLGGTPEKLFQMCWAVYSNEIEYYSLENQGNFPALMSQMFQAHLNSPLQRDFGDEKRKEIGN